MPAILATLVGLAGVLWPAPVASAAPHTDEDPFAAVDACLQQEMAARGVPGASMALAVDGQLAHTSAFGVRRADAPEPVDTETIFRINSTTKMMTAAAVMQQVEAGKLDLHAPLTDYVPDLVLKEPWQASSLTLHTLLANAGAVPDPYLDYSLMPRLYVIPDWGVDLSSWGRRLTNMHLYAPPGSFWNYSSPNFSLAGLALERVTGMRYEDYVTQRLWRPAGMAATTFDPDRVVASGDYAMGHVRGEVARAPGDYQRVYAAPAGGAFSTPTELITWALLLLNDGGQLLTPRSVQAMTTPYYEAEAVPWSVLSSYGYGVFIDSYQAIDDPSWQVQVMRHPGNGRGYSTEFVWVPEMDFAIAILVNEYTPMQRTVDCALREVLGLEKIPRSGLATLPSTWGRYAGTYAVTDLFGTRWTAHAALDDGRLRINYTDWALAPTIATLLPDGAPMEQSFLDTFKYTFAGTRTVTFEPDTPPGEHARWMRNQYYVGQRVGELPESLAIEGNGCATLNLVPGFDVPELKVRTHGLSLVRLWRDEPIEQEDPEDPASSGFKTPIEVDGHLGFLNAWLFHQRDDDLEMYVMQDQDGDGDFSWPEELVARLTSDSAQGIFVPERRVPGPYELWVHGEAVSGNDSTFDLDLVAVSGNELVPRGVPLGVDAGEPVGFQVCADPSTAYEDNRVGIVEIDFGAPGAIARVPVSWNPASEPPTEAALHLPLLLR
jgi:CubicO group peptidase (beta-lactamase class C family)